LDVAPVKARTLPCQLDGDSADRAEQGVSRQFVDAADPAEWIENQPVTRAQF
jgi:hypothetical protein